MDHEVLGLLNRASDIAGRPALKCLSDQQVAVGRRKRIDRDNREVERTPSELGFACECGSWGEIDHLPRIRRGFKAPGRAMCSRRSRLLSSAHCRSSRSAVQQSSEVHSLQLSAYERRALTRLDWHDLPIIAP